MGGPLVTRTCDGRCCAVFPLPKGTIALFEADPDAHPERRFTLDMLIPLTRRQALRRARRFGFTLPWRRLPNHDLFTCRHWNEETRLCGAYADRPRLCRDYPYERACDHADSENGCCYTTSKKTQATWRRIQASNARAQR